MASRATCCHLLHGWDWLTPEQRAVVADAVPRTLGAHAVSSDEGANWPAIVPNISRQPSANTVMAPQES